MEAKHNIQLENDHALRKAIIERYSLLQGEQCLHAHFAMIDYSVAITQQRDELLKIMDCAVKEQDEMGGIQFQTFNDMKAAIAKAKGGSS